MDRLEIGADARKVERHDRTLKANRLRLRGGGLVGGGDGVWALLCAAGGGSRGKFGTPAAWDFEDTCREYSWSRRLLAGAAGMWLMLVEH